MSGNKIVLGTRGSELALAQARLVEKALRGASPALNIEIRIIKTHGESVPNEPQDMRAGRKGIFTRAIEEALRRREIDMAVHSAKDLPSESAKDLEICATLARAATDDVLLMKAAKSLRSLSAGATVATGSVRRKHQLRWKRSDLRVLDLRGNVPTRLRKFIDSDWDAIVLARAGLERLGNNLRNGILTFEGETLNFEYLPKDDFLPAGGQGVIAIQVRRGDMAKLVRPINHEQTFLCLRAEREFLRLLQADCNAPVGVLATIESQAMTLRAQVFEERTGRAKMGEVKSSPHEQIPEQIAATLQALMYGKT
jgi:hydroxymethylbilane synthase